MSSQPQTGEIVGLVERYEGAADGRLTNAVTDSADLFDPADTKSEAAE
jgi:hypothetical protein